MGGGIKYSIFRGKGDAESADGVYTNTICLTAVISLLFVCVGLFFSGPLARLLGADESVFDMTQTYLRMLMLFAPAFIFNNVMNSFVRNDGDPRRSMVAMVVGSLSNVVLDYVFIFPLKMGIFGAVLATGVSPLIGLVILSFHWISKKNQFHFVKGRLPLRWTKAILSLGVPSLVTEIASGVVVIVFNMIILRLMGNLGVAAYGVVTNLSMIVLSIFTGIAQGIQPLISKASGHQQKEGIRLVLRYALISLAVLSCVIYLCIFCFADPITSLFNTEQNLQLQEIAVNGLKLYFTAVFFAGINTVLSTFFAAMGKALPAQIISLCRGIFFIIPLAFLMSSLWGITGVWLAFPVTEGCVAIAACVMKWKMKDRMGIA